MSTLNEDIVLQGLLNKILFVAMEDGIITDDELAILKQVKLDIASLRTKIIEAEKSTDVSEEDTLRLKEFRKNLLQNAYNISKSDKVITQDERNIINCLIRTLVD